MTGICAEPQPNASSTFNIRQSCTGIPNLGAASRTLGLGGSSGPQEIKGLQKHCGGKNISWWRRTRVYPLRAAGRIVAPNSARSSAAITRFTFMRVHPWPSSLESISLPIAPSVETRSHGQRLFLRHSPFALIQLILSLIRPHSAAPSMPDSVFFRGPSRYFDGRGYHVF